MSGRKVEHLAEHKVTNIRTQVYQLLKEEICSGVFPGGYRLQEVELANRYCVSRSPVREALRLLAADGLVVDSPNRGTFVRKFTRRDIEEICDIRVLLESYAIHILIQALPAEAEETLGSILSQMEQAYESENVEQYGMYDTQLHDALIRLCGNSILSGLYNRLTASTMRLRHSSLTCRERFQESMGEHRLLVQAVLGCREQEAQAVNQEHMEKTRKQLIRVLTAEHNKIGEC